MASYQNPCVPKYTIYTSSYASTSDEMTSGMLYKQSTPPPPTQTAILTFNKSFRQQILPHNLLPPPQKLLYISRHIHIPPGQPIPILARQERHRIARQLRRARQD